MKVLCSVEDFEEVVFDDRRVAGVSDLSMPVVPILYSVQSSYSCKREVEYVVNESMDWRGGGEAPGLPDRAGRRANSS